MKKVMSSIYKSIKVIAITMVLAVTLIGCSQTKENTTEDLIETKVSQLKEDEDYVTLDNISEDFLDAIVAVEDRRFYDHGAVDVISIIRATVKNVISEEVVEGGSTITQQLAKNLFLTSEKTMERKVKEVLIANELEQQYTKDEILEMYVNVIYFGDNHYGIGEASRGYFEKEPSELTYDEATLLAGLPQAPSAYALSKNYDRALKRQQEVINAMN